MLFSRSWLGCLPTVSGVYWSRARACIRTIASSVSECNILDAFNGCCEFIIGFFLQMQKRLEGGVCTCVPGRKVGLQIHAQETTQLSPAISSVINSGVHTLLVPNQCSCCDILATNYFFIYYVLIHIASIFSSNKQ